ncbi:uncharacterized protein LOC101212429 isoform X2 [Cucumis sativus]|uniref:uncharacterized protein LOC101212429 isoform X2 n=1 Tax=Cucumis sativus TaxID=3659 RepID=UPI0012F4B3DE|nr:uncharacterized protein LOC101212429 isoform X2 [Cucumis sativus]
MLMGNNSREDIMDLDLNQEPLDQSYDSVLGLDTILNDLETAHGRIEERIRQLEAVTTRATRRQRWRHAPTVTEPAETPAAYAHLERHETVDDSAAAQQRILHSEKTSKKNGPHLVAKALGMDSEPKATGNKMGSLFDCNICLDVAKDPILTCCGHLFCWSCFYQLSYVHSNAKECPECQGEVTDTSIIPIYGHGNGNRAQKSKPNDSGLKVPPRPRAQRIESMRQQILFRGTSSSIIEERIQQISNMIGAMGEQSRSQNFDVTHGRIERTNLLGRRRRATQYASQALPVPENENSQQNRSLQVSRLLLQGRSRPHSLPNNLNNGDSLSGIVPTVQSDGIAPDPVGGITFLVPQFESSSRSMDIATNIERLENQTSNATEFDRIILPSPSTRRRSELPRRSDVDNQILQERRRRRLG